MDDVLQAALDHAKAPLSVELERSDWRIIEGLLERERERCWKVAQRSQWQLTREQYERQSRHMRDLRDTITLHAS